MTLLCLLFIDSSIFLFSPLSFVVLLHIFIYFEDSSIPFSSPLNISVLLLLIFLFCADSSMHSTIPPLFFAVGLVNMFISPYIFPSNGASSLSLSLSVHTCLACTSAIFFVLFDSSHDSSDDEIL